VKALLQNKEGLFCFNMVKLLKTDKGNEIGGSCKLLNSNTNSDRKDILHQIPFFLQSLLKSSL